MGYCPVTWRGSDRGKCGPCERGILKLGSPQMEPCNRRRVAGPRSSQNYRMTQSQYSVNVLVWEVGAAELISIPAAWPEGRACCCSPGWDGLGLTQRSLGLSCVGGWYRKLILQSGGEKGR